MSINQMIFPKIYLIASIQAVSFITFPYQVRINEANDEYSQF